MDIDSSTIDFYEIPRYLWLVLNAILILYAVILMAKVQCFRKNHIEQCIAMIEDRQSHFEKIANLKNSHINRNTEVVIVGENANSSSFYKEMLI
jgi:hypothetical protein